MTYVLAIFMTTILLIKLIVVYALTKKFQNKTLWLNATVIDKLITDKGSQEHVIIV